jgi:hypothetical protein
MSIRRLFTWCGVKRTRLSMVRAVMEGFDHGVSTAVLGLFAHGMNCHGTVLPME